MVEGLGVRSGMLAPLDVGRAAPGRAPGGLGAAGPLLRAGPALPGRRWPAGSGLLTHRAELSEELARQAERRGEREAGEELAKLTRRQQEVAACIAEGLTNAEIAERLVLPRARSPTTSSASSRRLDLGAAPRSASGPSSAGCTGPVSDEDEE